LKEVDQSATQTDPNADPNKIVTVYQYDRLGNLARVDRANGDATNERVVDYAYDALNRVRKETQYPQGGWPATPNGSTTSPVLVTQTTYDPNSNRLTLTDPLNQLTTFGYDALNRLTSIAYSNPAPGTSATANVSYGFDADGNRTSMGDGTGTTSSSGPPAPPCINAALDDEAAA
jgi:YD repeat-containing protein